MATVNEIIKELKKYQDLKCGNYEVITYCYTDCISLDSKIIDIDHDRKEITI